MPLYTFYNCTLLSLVMTPDALGIPGYGPLAKLRLGFMIFPWLPKPIKMRNKCQSYLKHNLKPSPSVWANNQITTWQPFKTNLCRPLVLHNFIEMYAKPDFFGLYNRIFRAEVFSKMAKIHDTNVRTNDRSNYLVPWKIPPQWPTVWTGILIVTGWPKTIISQ